MRKEGVAHTILNFPIGVAWKIVDIKLTIYVKKPHIKLMSSLHIFKTWGFKAIYCWKYANNLNLNQAKCNFPDFHRSNKGVSRTLRKSACLKQNHFSINTSFFEFIAKICRLKILFHRGIFLSFLKNKFRIYKHMLNIKCTLSKWLI